MSERFIILKCICLSPHLPNWICLELEWLWFSVAYYIISLKDSSKNHLIPRTESYSLWPTFNQWNLCPEYVQLFNSGVQNIDLNRDVNLCFWFTFMFYVISMQFLLFLICLFLAEYWRRLKYSNNIDSWIGSTTTALAPVKSSQDTLGEEPWITPWQSNCCCVPASTLQSEKVQ